MTSMKTYRASERAITHPFKKVEGFFSKSALSISENHDFDESETFLNSDFDLETAVLKIQVAEEDIGDLGFDAVKARVSCLQVNSAARTSKVIASAELTSLNRKEIKLIDVVDESLPADSNTYQLLLHKEDEDLRERRKIFSRKIFRGRGSSVSKDFPKRWVTPSQLRELGVDGDTPWFLQWVSESYENTLDKLVVLCLNKNYEVHIKRLDSNEHQMLARQLWLSEIYSSILVPVLRKGLEGDLLDQEAVKQCTQLLKDGVGVEVDELHLQIRKSEFESYISACCKKLVGIKDSFGGLT